MQLLHEIDAEKCLRASEALGFIAALDQSGGSTPKALRGYGIEEDAYTVNGKRDDAKMFDLVHEMRTRIITAPAFSGNKVMGAILFEDTMNRKIEGLGSAEYLWQQKHIVPFLKCDKGLEIEDQGVQLMKPMPGLDEVMERAVNHGVFGTKMRSVIHHYNEAGIKAIVEQQFAIAKQIAKHGLVPILEPECNINSPDRADSEALLASEILKHAQTLDDNLRIMVKISIPVNPTQYTDVVADKHVLRVVALSGGFSLEEANDKLSHCPDIIASFSRALLQDLRVDQDDAEFNKHLELAVDKIYHASVDKV